MTRKRLNGWQRLFVLVAIIYFAVVATMTVAFMPKEKDVYSSWSYALVDLIKERENLDTHTYSLKNELFTDASDKDIVEKIGAGAKRTNDESYRESVTAIEKQYKERLESLPGAKWQAAGIGFVSLAVPLLLLYLFGYGIGWVCHGFRQQDKKA